ncbi:hypothetical protein F5J12DRAFT_784572 [Pisolithus orientalis]|uniref:uncharacterized protein n=1 Tax=Pisolithus orientalis TaxID=936130 RepID=UPI002224396C|nr:uncharacterized protein F5J12DRAFT_784572 [Pisolithus orientalis]KAI5999795.1 hypothetical protein F5J12DRAFT_784572 [Pisolithus orientalis]
MHIKAASCLPSNAYSAAGEYSLAQATPLQLTHCHIPRAAYLVQAAEVNLVFPSVTVTFQPIPKFPVRVPLGRMAIIPLIRAIIFALATLFSVVVLGICAHLEYLTSGNTNSYLSFAAFGLASACVTAVTLPLFFILGHARRGVFTSMVIFEIVWFLVLWVLWVATAGDTVVDRAYFFPEGCVLNNRKSQFFSLEKYSSLLLSLRQPDLLRGYCGRGISFLNFFAVFFYYDVLVLYAIICAIRGKGIWTISVRDAANSGPYNPVVAMTQPQYPQQSAPQYPQYPGYQNMPPANGYSPNGTPQPYNAYPQQTAPPVGQGQPYSLQQQYPGAPQQYPGAPQQQYPVAPQQQYPGTQQQQYPGAPHQQYSGGSQSDHFNPVQSSYSPNAPSIGNSPLPPQPHYNSYPGSYPQP